MDNDNRSMDNSFESTMRQCLYVASSCVLVAFGQPAWVPSLGIIASAAGYAIFWKVVLCQESPWRRFWICTAWFFCVQLVQLSWFISHPYLYIYAVYTLLSLILGLQFGVLGFFISRKTLESTLSIAAIAAIWMLLEWSRVFLLSGVPFDPIGLALAGNTYSLQAASIFGVFGLSFWVILTNLLLLRAWTMRWQLAPLLASFIAAIFPYVYGAVHLFMHERAMADHPDAHFRAVLVQTAFPTEEAIDFATPRSKVDYVLGEWRQILEILKKHEKRTIDLIVLPEFVVPYGTYANIYPLQEVEVIFKNILGDIGLRSLPNPAWPYAISTSKGSSHQFAVNNAYWAQSIANHFHASVLAGLEDAEDTPEGNREYYSAAILFHPQSLGQQQEDHLMRYEKRILVPMGEYIPFTFCAQLAQQYGIFGSFTPGKSAKVMICNQVPFSPSICYEEAFSGIMSEGRRLGAQMLVNMTNDGWYPNSRLPLQHFEHARLRTVENGVPLLRACNTGITAAVDSLGRTVDILGGGEPEKVEWVPNALYAEVPRYFYPTLYAQFGDKLAVGLSLLIILIATTYKMLIKKRLLK